MIDNTSFDDGDIFFDKKIGETDPDNQISEAEITTAAVHEETAKPEFRAAELTPESEPVSPPQSENPFVQSADDMPPCSGQASAAFDEVLAAVNNVAEKADLFSSQLNSLSAEISSVKAQVVRLAAYDTAVETLKRSLAANQTNENNLHKEVEEYKRGTYFTNIKPFLMFMIEMLCDLKNTKSEYTDDREAFISENSEKIYNEICLMLDYYIERIEGQLEIQGVKIISYENGSAYVPIRQKIAKTVATDRAELNGMLAKIYSDCYMYEEKILKPAKVHVYKLS